MVNGSLNSSSVKGQECAPLSEGVATCPENASLEYTLSLYADLSNEARDELFSINYKTITLRKSQKLYSSCHQGLVDIFILKTGWVSLCYASGSRNQDIYNIYMPGDIIGLRESLFDRQEIGIIAMENCQLDKFCSSEIHDLSKRHADIKRAIFSYIMINDNITIERLRSCTHHKAEKRIAHFLLEVLERHNFKKKEKSNTYLFPITQEVVGELLGITSIHVSRCMTAMEQKKLIRKSRNSIKVLQPELMAEYTGFDKQHIYGSIYID